MNYKNINNNISPSNINTDNVNNMNFNNKIKTFFNSYENKANLGQNIFLNSFIILGFIIASLFLFPIVSDSIFLEVCKSKFNELNDIMYPYFNLVKVSQNTFKNSNYKEIKKKRNKKNTKNLLKKILPWIIGFSLLFIGGCAYYIHNVRKDPNNTVSGWSLGLECIIIIAIMLSSFITEYFILTYVYKQYQFVPGISLLAILFNIFKSGLNENREELKKRIDNDISIDKKKYEKDKATSHDIKFCMKNNILE